MKALYVLLTYSYYYMQYIQAKKNILSYNT